MLANVKKIDAMKSAMDQKKRFFYVKSIAVVSVKTLETFL